jgi:hypothetical protein
MFSIFRRKPPVNPFADIPAQQADQIIKAETPKIPVYNGLAPKDRHDQIEYAFTSGGIHYFKFNAEVNVPFQRAIAARDILTEELWQINPDFLTAWNESLLAVILSSSLKAEKKIYEIGILANRLKEQMQLSFSLVRQLKLASVIYFDEQENPLDYQHPYNDKKIRFWMANNDVPGFFLKMLDFQSLPSLKEYQQNFPNYLQAETVQKMADLKHIISLMSSQKENEGLLNLLNSQMEMLSDISSWSKDRYTNIT